VLAARAGLGRGDREGRGVAAAARGSPGHTRLAGRRRAFRARERAHAVGAPARVAEEGRAGHQGRRGLRVVGGSKVVERGGGGGGGGVHSLPMFWKRT